MKLQLLPCFLFCPALLLAQAGTLDLDFSVDGLLVYDGISAYDDEVHGLVVQPDGKTIGVGWTDDGSNVLTFVQRLRQDGVSDPGFGVGGVVYSAGANELRYAYAVGLQSTGKIIVAGLVYDINMDGNAMLIRLEPDGTPDNTFGTNGFLSLDYGAPFGFQSAWAMQVMADDRIVLVGEEGENGIACVRLSADGVPDPNFGTNGVALTGVPFGSGLCLHVNDDGSVIVGGYRIDGGSDLLLARFDDAGVLDPGFGTGGITTLDLGGSDTEFMRSMDVLSDGRIAVCGSRSFNGLDDEPIVAVFTSDGDPDPGFGNSGLLLMPYNVPQWGQARSLIVQPGDKLLVSGFRAQPGGTANNDFFLFRLLDDGTYDVTFEGAGQLHTDVSGSFDRAFAMALAPSGAIVVAGYGTSTSRSAGYARYLNDIGMGTTELHGTGSLMSISPNPASDRVLISVAEELPANSTIKLFKLDGALVLARRVRMETNGKRCGLDLPDDLPAGSYLLEVGSVERTLRSKLTVLR